MSAAEPRPHSRMVAQPHDPYVGVHALSESLYCLRAARLVMEEDEEQIPERQTLLGTYSPFRFSPADPLLDLIQSIRMTVLSVLLAIGLAMVMWFAESLLPLLAIIGLFAACFISVGCSLFFTWRVVCSFFRYVITRMAPPREPPLNFSDCWPVNWWELLRAGWASIRYEQLNDDLWKFAGRPWRVLRKGTLRIPVIRMKGKSQELYPKYRARIAAYCQLLETCEGAHSPYGIVLFPRSVNGVAVTNDPPNRKLFHDALVRCRETLRNPEPPPAPASNVCAKCPHGRPKVHRFGITETWIDGQALPVYGHEGADERTYHSPCGDRYRWLPPHDRAREKQL